MNQQEHKHASIFQLDGVPKFSQAIPLALQHLVAMIVGCVTPSIIVANTINLDGPERVILIQSSLIVSALSTLLQLFPLGKKEGFHLGSALPVMMGVSFAYVPSMQSIAEDFGISAILGAQIVGGVVAFIIGMCIMRIRKYFPPIITGTVVFTIGLSLYPTAINYMAGGTGSPDYGSWQNWTVALVTLTVVTVLNHFGKGILKLASILAGIIVGYIISLFFHMVDFAAISNAAYIQPPLPLHFGITFEPSACVAIAILFSINSIQAMGDMTATTVGAMDREPTDKELQGGIMGYGVSSLVSALLGGLPTGTYAQNVGIVTATKVINRWVMGLTALLLLAAGLVPKFSAFLTTIPQCVLGGATVSVFASIAMTGMKLVTSEKMTYRNTSIVGLAAALGVGISEAPGALAAFPDWAVTIFGKSPVVVATIVAIFLNLILPKDEKKS